VAGGHRRHPRPEKFSQEASQICADLCAKLSARLSAKLDARQYSTYTTRSCISLDRLNNGAKSCRTPSTGRHLYQVAHVTGQGLHTNRAESACSSARRSAHLLLHSHPACNAQMQRTLYACCCTASQAQSACSQHASITPAYILSQDYCCCAALLRVRFYHSRSSSLATQVGALHSSWVANARVLSCKPHTVCRRTLGCLERLALSRSALCAGAASSSVGVGAVRPGVSPPTGDKGLCGVWYGGPPPPQLGHNLQEQQPQYPACPWVSTHAKFQPIATLPCICCQDSARIHQLGHNLPGQQQQQQDMSSA
jgi:hypothetical protein